MTKLICVREVQYVWSQNIFSYEVGDIVDGDENLMPNLGYDICILSLNWREYFINIAEYREQQINNILEEL